MKALLNRAKVALLMKVLTVLERLSRQIRSEIGVDYAIRGSIVANRGRSTPRPPMTLISREFAHTRRPGVPPGSGGAWVRQAVGRWASRRKFPLKIEFDSDDDLG